MRGTAIVAAGILAAAALSGCAQMGMFNATHQTTVELAEPNFKVVAVGVSGQAKAGYLLGVSFGNGPQAGSVALARVDGTGQLYKEAMAGLWSAFEKEHGAVEGRRLALTNVRYDTDTKNFLLYTDIKLAIRADVIEFTD